ncbi:unnamed protein product, partial [Mesorhabditis spiculigera]
MYHACTSKSAADPLYQFKKKPMCPLCRQSTASIADASEKTRDKANNPPCPLCKPEKERYMEWAGARGPRCSVPDCTKSGFAVVTCKSCQKPVCVPHQVPDEHDCRNEELPKKRTGRSKALLGGDSCVIA